MMLKLRSLVLAGALLAASSAAAKPKSVEASSDDYAKDVITVATPGRDQTPPSTICVIWVNAEGLGVGPTQLGGYHGLSLTTSAGPSGINLDQAFTYAKSAYPGAPAWMWKAAQAQASAISKACSGEHLSPVVIRKLSPRDARG